jgi:PAS domain S-box-containing protein
VDASGRIELVNAQAERLFGWSAPELLGQTIETLVPEAVVERHVRHRASYVADPRPRPMGAGLRLSARRQDGSTFPTEISLSAVTDESGEVLLVLAAVRDATERLELEAERQRQALAAQREQSHRLESLGELAGGVAHDFNNLLGVILNYTTLLSRRISDPERSADLGEIRAAAERAAGLTRQLLTFARRDAVKPRPLEVNGIVREVASMLDRTLGEHITLRLDLADAPLVALADRHQLEQIVLNLAINARDAMPSGGLLVISTAPSPPGEDLNSPPGVVLRVVDTGYGMASDVVARAFEPFFTTKPRGQGTGLGLASVYGIVQQNGGQVTIDSTVGTGTAVTVVLTGAGEATPASGLANEPSPRGHERILLVEDQAALRAGTARILREQGYTVLVAAGGIEALEVFDREAGDIDVVVTDVVMPRGRGDELAQHLATRRPSLPVIFISGYDSGEPSLKGQLKGQLLTKPVTADILLHAVREALDG